MPVDLCPQYTEVGTSLAVQRLGLALSLQEGEGSIPGLGTKILHAVHYDKKRNKQKKDLS